jgi:hypothetical protein
MKARRPEKKEHQFNKMRLKMRYSYLPTHKVIFNEMNRSARIVYGRIKDDENE